MIHIPFITLFREFMNMQKQLWRTRAIRNNGHANIGIVSRCSMSGRVKESSMFNVLQDCLFPEKVQVLAIYIIKLGS